jgi:acid phosphatase family membrane protein YuiD
LSSKLLIALIGAWVLAKVINGIIDWRATGKFSKKFLFRSGGMPSSHSACVTALATGVYLIEGYSTLFIMSLAFAVLVMYDAQGVRYQVGQHAKLLNQKHGREFNVRTGHTKLEVVVGGLIGIVVSLLLFFIL